MDLELIKNLAIALVIGLMIGMERSWQSHSQGGGARSAGLRTFGFIGLLGGISVLLSHQLGVGVVIVTFAALAAIVVAAYILTAHKTGEAGITTEIAILLTFALGMLTLSGYAHEAIAGAVVISALLRFKPLLHSTLRKLEHHELNATLQLLIVAAVVLPLLPDRYIDPFQSINPRTIGYLVLLIAGLSYIGYFATRIFGARSGILATALLGGLASSTAVTIAFSRLARRLPEQSVLLGLGIAAAAAIMVPRVLLEVLIVNKSLLPLIIWPLIVLMLVPAIAATFVLLRKKNIPPSAQVPLNNPLELNAAIGYSILLTLLFLLVHITEKWVGESGIYALAALSGIANVDAISLSLAGSALKDMPSEVAARGILIACVVNTGVKAALAVIIGGWHTGKWTASILGLACVLGGVALWGTLG
ncbi:MAG: MgtC/SapB family protein [Gammaproteobacteria bacterium]|nr:MgtC/SapB family protein [Gammaproteobacteria bacterium]